MEGAIGVREHSVVGNDFFEAVILELALDHFDQGVARHSVKLDAFIEQDVDLRAGGAVLGEPIAQDARACPRRCGGLSLEARDVGKPEPEQDTPAPPCASPD